MSARKTKSEVDGIYPLNFLQQALLFHGLQESDDQGFLQVRCKLKGKIDVEAFKRAWRETIQRHESLRTSIHWENLEKPLQVVHKAGDLPFSFLDWAKHPEAEQESRLAKLLSDDAGKKFVLSENPVLRVKLIELSSGSYFLIWSCHHILADGWSASIVLRDLVGFYDQFTLEIEPDFEAVPSYKTYLEWVRKQDSSEASLFWKEELSGFKKPALIADRVLPNTKEKSEFRVEEFSFSEEESEQLREFSKKHQITISTLVHSIWALLVSRLSASNDLVFGTISSGRSINLPNVEKMAGMLMNVLPIRVNLPLESSFSDWLKDLQIQLLKIRSFEYVGLDEIQMWNDAGSESRLFDNLLVFENTPLENIAGKSIAIEEFESGLTSNYPLTFAFNPAKQFMGFIKYDSALVSNGKIEWLIENLQDIRNTLVGDSNDSLSGVLEKVSPYRARAEIDRMVESDEVLSVTYVAPRNDIELELTGLWEELLDKQPIGVADNFFDIGGTSIIAIRLFSEIERRMDQKLQPAKLLQHNTIESLSKLIEKDNPKERFSTLVPLRASGSKPPLFCLHAGGGHVFFYRELAKYLGNEQPLYAIQRIGLDDITQAEQDIETMAATYLADIQKIQPEGPYSFLAYCFSTLIAWEMTRQLQNAGEDVAFLAVVDSPPFYTDRRTVNDRIGRVIGEIRKFNLSFLKTIWQGRIKHPIEEKRDFLFAGKREKTNYKLMQALNASSEAYKFEVLPVKVSLFRSESMSKIPEQNRAVEEWNDLALRGVETVFVGGHHDLLFEEPMVKELARQIENSLEKLDS